MNRRARGFAVALLIAALAALSAVAPAAASVRVPRVVLVVGPVGSLTAEYRQLANVAAREAIDAGADVTRIYSPNATWPAVKRALPGASIVVYLGHGNGWPSIYRDALYPPTQNGLGLNPVAGVDDVAHQYFGEAWIDDVRLASNAVVLLHHLCYASGNSEPGLPEGSEAMSIQRVDNYAAGFIRAGAEAVVAEAQLGPAYYVRSLLRTQLSIEQIWRTSPTSNGNATAFASLRSPGFTERLDPERPGDGFYRSVVSRGVSSTKMRSGATGTIIGSSAAQAPVTPSLAGQGIVFGQLRPTSVPIVSVTSDVTLPLRAGGLGRVPDGTKIGVRWDPILLDPDPSAPQAPPAAASAASAATAPPASASAGRAGSPAASSPGPALEAPDVDLVVAEQLGSVVSLQRATRRARGLGVSVTFPSAPGLYRLVVSIHDRTGLAYDQATQTMLRPVIVHVGGPFAAAFGAPTALALATAQHATIAVRVMNAGSQVWDAASATPPAESDALLSWLRTSRIPPRLVATWVSTAGIAVPVPESLAIPSAAEPGGAAAVVLRLDAPPIPGEYLLLLDVLTPTHGALSTLGNAPALIRVSVDSPR